MSTGGGQASTEAATGSSLNFTLTDAIDAATYAELRAIAAAQLRATTTMSLRATELTNEAWIRMSPALAGSMPHGRFFGLAAMAIRAAMVDHWRARQAHKRGSDYEIVALDELAAHELPLGDSAERYLELSQLIDRLQTEHPDLAQLIELRCFGGLSIEDAAECMGISVPTAVRRWRFGKAWVLETLRGCTDARA